MSSNPAASATTVSERRPSAAAWPVLLWALGALAPGTVARAERPPPATVTSAAATPSASDDPQLARAKQVIARGEALFDLGNFEAALSDFTQAFELLRGHPRRFIVLHNLAVCHERLFHYDLALDLYAKYLRDGGPDAPDRAAVEAVLASLGALLGSLRIDTNVPAEVWVDDRRMAEAPGSLRLPAGRHVIELRAHLHQAVRRELRVQPRHDYELEIELQRLSDYRGLHPAYFWSGAALTAAALVTGSVLGVRALDARSTEQAALAAQMHLRTPEAESAERSVRRLSLGADVAFGAAALFAAATVVLAFSTDWGDAELRGSLAASHAGMSVEGEWP
jgi:tetratricopeptide (TPR) repeat protein